MTTRLLSHLLFAVLCCTSTPTLAQDYDVLIRQGMQERDAGDLAAAERTLWQAYELADNKSEISYLLGQVLAYEGLYAEALTLIDDALAVYPDDANLLLARTQVLDLRASSQTPVAGAQLPAQQLTTGYSRSTIDRAGFADWSDRFVEYRHLAADGGQQFLRAEHNHRFGLHDSTLAGGLVLQPDNALPLEIAAGFTPDDDFMPEYFARIGASKVVAQGGAGSGTLVLTGLYQHSSYANGRTNRLLAGFEYYLPSVDAWLTPSIGMVRDQNGTNTFAWSFGAHWQIAGATRIGINYSDAPETENLITKDSQSWNTYWQQDLGSRWRLFLYYTRLDLDQSYVRESADLALQLRF